MNLVYSDQFIKVFQSDAGHTYTSSVDGKSIVLRKHCVDYVAEVKIAQRSHEDALASFAYLSESNIEQISSMLP